MVIYFAELNGTAAEDTKTCLVVLKGKYLFNEAGEKKNGLTAYLP